VEQPRCRPHWKFFILGTSAIGNKSSALTLVLPGYLHPELMQRAWTVSGSHIDATMNLTLVHATAQEIAWAIISGILNKKRRIFFPAIHARILWHLAHWFPFIVKPLQKRFLKAFQ
jgi:hypothetical protein